MALDTQALEDATERRIGPLLDMKATARITLLLLLLSISAIAQQRLLVVGGGERPADAMKKFVEWSGGAKSRVLVVTWASGVPEESFVSLNKGFKEAGAAEVVHAPVRPLDNEKRKVLVDELSKATGVFFSGGDQNRIMDVLADEELYKLLREKYEKGIAFGGTSAGAAVMSDPMMTGEADLKVLDGTKVGVRKGLGLLPNVIFDQHFLLRQRHNRLFGLVLVNPTMLGIGIDEDTAVLIEDNRRLTVAGATQVMFAHTPKGRQPLQVSFLKPGGTFDVKKRKAL